MLAEARTPLKEIWARWRIFRWLDVTKENGVGIGDVESRELWT